MAIESKSFDFDIVRTEEDLLRISENGRGRRFSLLLLEQVSLWLLRAWGRFCKSKSPFGAINCVKAQVASFWSPREIRWVSYCNYL